MSKRPVVIKIRYDEIPDDLPECIACIGFFDSLHKGHQQLISRCLFEAETNGLIPALICFDKDPLEIITGQPQPHILSNQERIAHIHALGIEMILMFEFDKKLMNVDHLHFISDYLEKMHLRKLICGFDFRFGYQGKGDKDTLKRYGSFETIVIPEIDYYHKKISSTRIKQEINRGNLRLAERLLGYRYYLDVEVLKSEKTGENRLLVAKCPDALKVMPPDGVYADQLQVKDGLFRILSHENVREGQRIKVEP